MSSYVVVAGDTFELISRKVYGTEAGAGTIRLANPDLRGGLIVGAEIVTPDLVSEFEPDARGGGESDEWTIRVSGREFRFWRDAEVTRAIDSPGTFSFSAPFEPGNEGFRGVFRPLSFQPTEVLIGGRQVMGGTMVDVTPKSGANREVVVSGYSRSGVLSDCTLPADTPLEFDEATLQNIAENLCKPFGLLPVFRADPGPVFENGLSIGAVDRPMGFLAKLAQQRGLVIGATPKGNPLFHRTTTAPAVASFTEGVQPLQSVEPVFKAQNFYSHISSLTPSYFGGEGDFYTVVNPNLRGVVRPHTFRVDDSLGADGVEATEAKVGRMYANAAAWDVSLVGIANAAGEVWNANTIVSLLAPSAMIYRRTDFLVRTAAIARKGRSLSTRLRLVLPESFNSAVPAGFPWDS